MTLNGGCSHLYNSPIERQAPARAVLRLALVTSMAGLNGVIIESILTLEVHNDR